jgi:hypothetical protein
MILEIKKILEDNDVNFVFHPKSENLPVDKLDIELIIENYPTNLSNKIELIFVPGLEEATKGLSMLQFYCILNLKINEKEELDFKFYGNDIDKKVLEMAKRNAKSAGVAEHIIFKNT